jgi:ferrous iron transport protein A
MEITLDKLKVGQKATIKEFKGSSTSKRAILKMGVLPGETIEVIRVAPFGDPIDFLIKGYQLSFRKKSAKQIIVEVLES